MQEKDYKSEFEILQKKAEKLQEDYNRMYRDNCDLSSTNRELKIINEKLIKSVENLSNALEILTRR